MGDRYPQSTPDEERRRLERERYRGRVRNEPGYLEKRRARRREQYRRNAEQERADATARYWAKVEAKRARKRELYRPERGY